MMASVGCTISLVYFVFWSQPIKYIISACCIVFECYQVASTSLAVSVAGMCCGNHMDQDNEASHNVEANHHLRMPVEEFLSPIFNSGISFLNITNMQLR